MNEYSGNFDLNSVSSLPRWFGRVVSDVSWQDNIESELFSQAEQQKGWGYRYRIRYFGLHSASTQDLPDEQLPMANVVMPVTAGSGLGGFHDTPALSSGSIVTGYFLDGMGGQEPYIDGVLINSNNEVPKEQPKDQIGGLQLFNQTYKEGPLETGAFVPAYLIGDKSYWKTIQSIGDKMHLGDGAVKAWEEQQIDRERVTPLASPCKTDNSPMKGIQQTMKNLLSEIEKYDTIVEIFGSGDPNREKFIQKVLDIASGDIVGYLKTIFQDVRGYVMNFFAEQAKKELPFLFPSEVPEFTEKVEKGNNLISCLFNKLVRQLPNLIKDLLKNLLNSLVNAPLCFVENLIGDFLNNSGILDQISNVVNQALSLFNQAIGIIGEIGDFLFNALDFVTGILNFFKCDDDADCPQVQQINLAGAFSPGGDPPISFNQALQAGNLISTKGNGDSSPAVDYSVAFKQ